MIEEDLRQLRQVLARAVQASGRTRRDLERKIGVRSGGLALLLDGRQEITVKHLTAFARLLRIPPGDFLAAGCPALRAAATHRLAEWIGPAGNSKPSPPPSPEALVEMIRAAVRQELAARKGNP